MTMGRFIYRVVERTHAENTAGQSVQVKLMPLSPSNLPESMTSLWLSFDNESVRNAEPFEVGRRFALVLDEGK